MKTPIDSELAALIEVAKAKYTVEWWDPDHDPKEMAYYQLHEPVWLVRFGDFHVAVEKLLARSVWAHEFMLCLSELKVEAARARSGRPYTLSEKDEAVALGKQRLEEALGTQVEYEENSPLDLEGIAKDRRLS